MQLSEGLFTWKIKNSEIEIPNSEIKLHPRIIPIINTQIAFIARQIDLPIFNCFYYRASGFINVTAAVKAALVEQGTHFGEKVAKFLFVDIDNAQFADTGGIDDKTS